MFHFWAGVEKLTLVAGCLSFYALEKRREIILIFGKSSVDGS